MMQVIDIEKVTLSDGITYIIVDEIEINNNKYVYLTNENNEKDFCIRKSILENDEEIFIGLDDEDEFNKALLYFVKKNNL